MYDSLFKKLNIFGHVQIDSLKIAYQNTLKKFIFISDSKSERSRAGPVLNLQALTRARQTRERSCERPYIRFDAC